jgi:hypothetical protein
LRQLQLAAQCRLALPGLLVLPSQLRLQPFVASHGALMQRLPAARLHQQLDVFLLAQRDPLLRERRGLRIIRRCAQAGFARDRTHWASTVAKNGKCVQRFGHPLTGHRTGSPNAYALR